MPFKIFGDFGKPGRSLNENNVFYMPKLKEWYIAELKN